MSKKHAQIEQLDGSSSMSEDSEEKYSRTIHYWREGKLGTVFQFFLDANDVIEESDITEEMKKVVKAKNLKAPVFFLKISTFARFSSVFLDEKVPVFRPFFSKT